MILDIASLASPNGKPTVKTLEALASLGVRLVIVDPLFAAGVAGHRSGIVDIDC